MYKTKRYEVRPWVDLEKDIHKMAKAYPDTKRIFLADGDVIGVDTAYLIKVLSLLNEKFPRLEKINIYAGPTNLLHKSVEELKAFKELKLSTLYLGIETGNDELLKRIKKGATAEQIIEGCTKALKAGLRMSTIILLGLGGVEGSLAHAKDSAKVVNAIDPQFVACLTLMLGPYKELYEKKLMGGGFELPDKRRTLQELRWFSEDLNLTNCRFGTEHASNYLPISGAIPADKEKILALIDQALNNEKMLRPEWARGL